MATFELAVSTNKVGSKCTLTFEMDDDDAYNDDGTQNVAAIEETAKELLPRLMSWEWFEVKS